MKSTTFGFLSLYFIVIILTFLIFVNNRIQSNLIERQSNLIENQSILIETRLKDLESWVSQDTDRLATVILQTHSSQEKLREMYQKDVENWTIHLVHPLKGDPWVEFTEGQRNPDVAFRPPVPSRLKKYIDSQPPSTSFEHGWKDTTIDGGYLWEEF